MMSNKQLSVPIIDVGPLFQDDSSAWETVDAQIGSASKTIGAFVATGMPDAYRVDDEDVATLHSVFDLPQAMRDAIGSQSYNPANNHKWRGYSATLKAGWAHNEFFDIGPEHSINGPNLKGIEILTEGNIWPTKEPVAGWREAMRQRWQAMHKLSALLFRSLLRALGADEIESMTRFASDYATLRLLNYPKKPEGVDVGGQVNATRVYDGLEQPLLTVEHDDSCCLSLLWQDQSGGLQVQTPDGEWLVVPKVAGSVSVHFGTSMAPLTAGLLQATPHRVLGDSDRQSMGFFFELDLDAELSPLPNLAVNSLPSTGVDTYGSALLKTLVKRGQYLDLIEV
ncbi:MAG: 2OG-Fe(II) oxygenase family protein [Chloroflexota bacterium]